MSASSSVSDFQVVETVRICVAAVVSTIHVAVDPSVKPDPVMRTVIVVSIVAVSGSTAVMTMSAPASCELGGPVAPSSPAHADSARTSAAPHACRCVNLARAMNRFRFTAVQPPSLAPNGPGGRHPRSARGLPCPSTTRRRRRSGRRHGNRRHWSMRRLPAIGTGLLVPFRMDSPTPNAPRTLWPQQYPTLVVVTPQAVKVPALIDFHFRPPATSTGVHSDPGQTRCRVQCRRCPSSSRRRGRDTAGQPQPRLTDVNDRFPLTGTGTLLSEFPRSRECPRQSTRPGWDPQCWP